MTKTAPHLLDGDVNLKIGAISGEQWARLLAVSRARLSERADYAGQECGSAFGRRGRIEASSRTASATSVERVA